MTIQRMNLGIDSGFKPNTAKPPVENDPDGLGGPPKTFKENMIDLNIRPSDKIVTQNNSGGLNVIG